MDKLATIVLKEHGQNGDHGTKRLRKKLWPWCKKKLTKWRSWCKRKLDKMVQMGQKGQNGDHGAERTRTRTKNGGHMQKAREIDDGHT